jgi:hypothetical protein
MKHEIKDGDRLIATIETHGQAIVVVHEPQKEIKPVQFADDRDTYVECTPEQRAEIIRVADEYGRELYDVSKDVEFYRQTYKNLAWNMDDDGPYLYETNRTKLEDAGCLWLPFDEFVSRLKGEWADDVERIIPFDAERWRSGDFVRVQTRDGREVKQLTEFESVKFGERFSGVFNLSLKQWYEHGAFLDARIDDRDLMLVVKGEGGQP